MNVFRRFFDAYFSKKALPYWCVLLMDMAIVAVSGFVATYFVSGGDAFVGRFWGVTSGIAVTACIYVVFFKAFHTYSGIVRYSSFVDLKQVCFADILAMLLIMGLSLLLDEVSVSFPVLPAPLSALIQCLLSITLMWFVRISVKVFFDSMHRADSSVKVFVYGARGGAVAVAKSFRTSDTLNCDVVGFVDSDNELEAAYIMGAQVYPDDDNLVKRMKKAGAFTLVLSPIQMDKFRLREKLINDLTEAGMKILTFPEPERWDGHSPLSSNNIRHVQIEDLLPREQISVDMGAISDQLSGKRILITGAAGSIGSEIVRQVFTFHPSTLVLVDQAETPMHDLRRWADERSKESGIVILTVVADICDEAYMDRIFCAYRPEYVFHAAAYKHVPMMEDNPEIAVKNNICGTRNIADLSVKYGVLKFVMVSTDKAVNPTNVMGCSKRICEIYCQSFDRAIREGKVEGVTQFVTTRFGNVLGSNGSVIPTFREQILKGGPVTVTDPEVIRYFMLIPEACKLVLEAAAIGRGGEIFVFDMGKPVKIYDLARKMISLSGAKDVQISITGLRDGEKLFEEVLSDAEKTAPTSNPKIFVAKVREYDYDLALSNGKRLLDIASRGDRKEIVRTMMSIVPEYHSTNAEYKDL